MISQSHRRQVVLFLVAVAFPSAMLVALGFRMIGQQRDLTENRVANDRRRAVADVRQAMYGELDRIVAQALADLPDPGGVSATRAYRDTAVQLVAPVGPEGMVFPWEPDGRMAAARAVLAQAPFARSIAAGERAELGRGDVAAAIDSYRKAIRGARAETQSAYGRLLLARALATGGHTRDAREQYDILLATSSEVVDEHGVPFSLYAAARLIDRERGPSIVMRRIREVADSPVWRSPTAVYLLRDLLTRLSTGPDSAQYAEATALLDRVKSEVQLVERVLALQQQLSMMQARSQAGESWTALHDVAWLATIATAPGSGREAVIAVSTAEVVRAVTQSFAVGPPGAPFEIRSNGAAAGEPLAAELPDLTIIFLETTEETIAREVGLRSSFYLAVFLLVFGIAVFGGYLLWRDVRREMRLAQIRSDFVSSVSHELKTPLTAIRMFAETLRMRDRPDPAMQTEYLDTIVGESERLTRLLNNVLDVSKIEQGQRMYRREMTSLSDIIRRAERALEYQLGQDGFRLQVRVQDGVPSVSVDGDAVEQAILNLLTNAMKYSGASRDIDLRVGSENAHAVIAVTDRGLGIPGQEQDRLTEKFYRVRSADNDRIPGTGLGLTIVDHTARAHGGYLTVESATGKGSTFAIHLPLENNS